VLSVSKHDRPSNNDVDVVIYIDASTMAPYNLRPHPKPARPTNGTSKPTKQSKPQKEKQIVNLKRGLLSLGKSTVRLEFA
jgi:hypothetical protein